MSEEKNAFKISAEIYSEENIPLYEAMYGPGLISLGGYEAIDDMVKGMDIEGKQILDVGAGIGGMAHYLAQKYQAFVTGLEIYSWMATYAMNHAPDAIKNKVNFITYTDDGLIPLPSQTIDVICSKGVLTNIPDKRPLFHELYRLLKPSGQICFMDWVVPEEMGPQHKTFPWGEVSAKETESSYAQLLADCGFVNITFEDESEAYLRHAQKLESTLTSDNFKNLTDADLQELLMTSNTKLIHDIESGNQLSVRIRAGVA
jgi:ubiquinone/menaquinone biosynthesis C-methylase UbiE